MDPKQSVIPFSHEMSFHRPDRVDSTLYVVTPIFNPVRFRKRWMLYKKFEQYVLSFPGVQLVTIEAAFGDRAAVVEKSHDRHTVITVRTSSEIWTKENLINLAVQRLPHDWKYVAWIDADVQFARPDWVGETVQQLQHYDYVQMFSNAHDLNDRHEVIKSFTGFAYCYHNVGGDNRMYNQIPTFNKKEYTTSGNGNKGYWHPGFAHACTRKFFDAVGGLIDWTILGGGDTYMMYAIAGMLTERTMPRSLGDTGIRWLREWEQRAERYSRRNFGYVHGDIFHYYHGSRADRGYQDRGQILTSCQFDPELDIKKDSQGLWQLTDRNYKLRDQIRAYFRRRNEDS